MNKKDIFSKITQKDYSMRLEEILEKKNFSVSSKNLLLSMLYKIDLLYRDYEIIKKTELKKNQLLEELLEIIELECEKIELVEPKSKKGQVLAKYGMKSISDTQTKTIISYPLEKELLYALYGLKVNQFYINNNHYIVNKTLPLILKIGNKINNKEIIRDFTGWSWNIDKNDIENYEYNLMFQNLRMLIGEGFLFEWKNSKNNDKDYLIKLKEYFSNNNYYEMFYECFIRLSMVLAAKNDSEIEKYVFKEKKKIKDEIDLMNNKTRFLEKITKEKRKLNEKINQIDKLVNNKELLEKEYKANKKEQNIANIKTFEFMLRDKRKALLDEISNYTKLMNPKKYADNLNELKRRDEILDKIDKNMFSEEWINKAIIELQKYFLYCFKVKLENTKIKKEVTQFIYYLRYYKNIALNKYIDIYEIEELRAVINNIEDILIAKAINTKTLNIISKNSDYNIEIIKKVMNSKIINLENIEIEIIPKYNKLEVCIYDGDVMENHFEIESNNFAEKADKKSNKKIKLFV